MTSVALLTLCALSVNVASAQETQQTTTTQTVTTTTTVDDNNDDSSNDPTLRRGEFGLRYMPTFGSLDLRTYNNSTVKGSMSLSHGWGIMLGFNFNHHVGVQGEINYNEINQKWKDQSLNRTVHVSYLNIPVMLSLNTDKAAPVNLNFVVGPQFALNVGSSIKGDSKGNTETLNATVAARSGDVGAAYGAGLEFMLNKDHTLRLDLGFRGYYGFVDMSADQTNNNPDTYNVLVSASRKTYAGYIGLSFLF
jgi:hypothetical protein